MRPQLNLRILVSTQHGQDVFPLRLHGQYERTESERLKLLSIAVVCFLFSLLVFVGGEVGPHESDLHHVIGMILAGVVGPGVAIVMIANAFAVYQISSSGFEKRGPERGVKWRIETPDIDNVFVEFGERSAYLVVVAKNGRKYRAPLISSLCAALNTIYPEYGPQFRYIGYWVF